MWLSRVELVVRCVRKSTEPALAGVGSRGGADDRAFGGPALVLLVDRGFRERVRGLRGFGPGSGDSRPAIQPTSAPYGAPPIDPAERRVRIAHGGPVVECDAQPEPDRPTHQGADDQPREQPPLRPARTAPAAGAFRSWRGGGAGPARTEERAGPDGCEDADASGADEQSDDDQDDARQDPAADDADDAHDHQHDRRDPRRVAAPPESAIPAMDSLLSSVQTPVRDGRCVAAGRHDSQRSRGTPAQTHEAFDRHNRDADPDARGAAENRSPLVNATVGRGQGRATSRGSSVPARGRPGARRRSVAVPS